jgi:hypothetical protein
MWGVSSTSHPIIVAVAGMGGAGKTVLVRRYAVEHQDAYYGVWWINAEKRGDMIADLAALGVEISAAIKAAAENNIEQAARSTLRMIENAGYSKPFLLIYDNVERPAHIEHWTPRSGAHILLSTRFTDWDPMVAKVEVGVLDRETAVDFLCRRALRPDDRDEARLLADELGCLPLALDHSASYCRAPPRPTFRAYRERMLATRLAHKPTAGSSPGQYPRSVRETISLALERVMAGDAAVGVKACPEAEIIMGIAALLAPAPVPYSIFSHPRLYCVKRSLH